jgi:hypothetical protein
MELIKSELQWWEHHEGGDVVRTNVLHTWKTGTDDKGKDKLITSGQDLELSDAAMDDHAKAEGKTSWDNDTVAAFAGEALGITVTRKPAPEPLHDEPEQK